MCGDFQILNFFEVGVCLCWQLIGEKLFDIRGAVFAGWQADGMDHNQVNLGIVRASITVG